MCVDHDSDSDSDLSELEDDQSGSYASTHSSDSEEDEGEFPQEECWENLATSGPIKPHGTTSRGSHNSILRTNWYDVISYKISSFWLLNTFELPLVRVDYAMGGCVLKLRLLWRAIIFFTVRFSFNEVQAAVGVCDIEKKWHILDILGDFSDNDN